MKKLLLAGMIATSIFAQNIKTNDGIIGFDVGRTTTNASSKNYVEVKIGKYFYDENIYQISNRIYISGLITTPSTQRLGIGKVNLDWIWNTIPYIKPFMGFSTGYLYNKDDSANSTSLVGFQAGALLYLGTTVEFEAGISIDRPTQNKDVWTENLKKIYAGITFSF